MKKKQTKVSTHTLAVLEEYTEAAKDLGLYKEWGLERDKQVAHEKFDTTQGRLMSVLLRLTKAQAELNAIKAAKRKAVPNGLTSIDDCNKRLP